MLGQMHYKLIVYRENIQFYLIELINHTKHNLFKL